MSAPLNSETNSSGDSNNMQPKDRHRFPSERYVPSSGRDFDVDEEFDDKDSEEDYQKGSKNDAQMSESSGYDGKKEYQRKENTHQEK